MFWGKERRDKWNGAGRGRGTFFMFSNSRSYSSRISCSSGERSSAVVGASTDDELLVVVNSVVCSMTGGMFFFRDGMVFFLWVLRWERIEWFNSMSLGFCFEERFESCLWYALDV